MVVLQIVIGLVVITKTSCRFSHQPIQWYYGYHRFDELFLVCTYSSHCEHVHCSAPCNNYITIVFIKPVAYNSMHTHTHCSTGKIWWYDSYPFNIYITRNARGVSRGDLVAQWIWSSRAVLMTTKLMMARETLRTHTHTHIRTGRAAMNGRFCWFFDGLTRSQ